MEASRKLPDYLRERPLPFYPWLRQLAWNHLIDLHRRHIKAQRRTVTREEPLGLGLSSHSRDELVSRLVASGTSPSQHLVNEELRTRLREGLEQLADHDREVLVLWYLEQLSAADIGAILSISEHAVHMRHLRAVRRLRALLDSGEDGGE